MNDLARERLIEAHEKKVRQLIGIASDGHGGFCAAGWLAECQAACFNSDSFRSVYGLGEVTSCPECGATHQTLHSGWPINNEWSLLVHFNNDHKWDWLTIARKMP